MVSNFINHCSAYRWTSWWFLLARKYMMDLKNPPINEEMLRMMMMQMGQNHRKINQMMTMMNKNMDQNMKSSKIFLNGL